jgi:iron complex transport system ATP-binding protein
MLSIRDLHAGYGNREVLRGVDLNVAAGEVVALVGPNGCGKTTLLNAMTRLAPLRAGEITLDGRSVQSFTARELARRIAVVPQQPAIPTGFTALELVLMGRTPHLGFFEHEGPRDHDLALRALALANAGALAERRVDELSGGERQRIVLARALAQGAPLLLLDEPTANLDLANQIAIMSLLRRLSREDSMAVLAAVHDLSLASLYCDRLALMAEGCIVAAGAPRSVLTPANLRLAYGIEPVVLDMAMTGPIVLPLSEENGSREIPAEN